jgi:DNA (cytosine-5)-methyltransferase 1
VSEAELIIDSFAGGGGASTGIELALGRSPDYAINHDAVALSLHAANHPTTKHLSENIFKVDPLDVVGRQPVGLLWASPDCKHFSKAKGGAPVQRNIRDLAWVVVSWAQRAKPRVIILENVEEFRGWGPLVEDADGRLSPCPDRKGETFAQWVKALKREGYKVEWRELRACDYGAPTIRKRLFVIARRDKRPIVWPAPTHGRPTDPDVIAGRKLPWRVAAEIIDWSLPCPSIFDTAAEIYARFGLRAVRPLKPATMARIAKGVKRYVIDAVRPFIVPLTHAGAPRAYDIDDPLRTVTGAHRGEMALVTPFVAYGQQGGAVRSADDPLHTVTASAKDTNAVVAPVIVGCGGRAGQSPARPGDAPLGTLTAKADGCLVAPVLAAYYGEGEGGTDRAAPLDEPLRTVTVENRHALISPFMVPRYGERAGQDPRTLAVDEPMPTVVPTGNGASLVAAHLTRQFGASVGSDADEPAATETRIPKTGVVAAFLAQHNEGPRQGAQARSAGEPISTITTTGGQQGLVAAHMLNLRGSDRRDGECDAPAPSVSAGGNHVAEVRVFLVAYYGNEEEGQAADEPMRTVTTRDRLGLVMVEGVPHQIVDIGMRMLTPRERFSAQGFPASYRIDRGHDGRKLTLEAQGRMVGNSVCPPLAQALVAANCADMAVIREAAE